MEIHTSSEENALQVYGRDLIIQNKAPRRKNKQHKKDNILVSCKFDFNKFLPYLAGILLETNEPVMPVQPTYRYLGVVGLVNNKSAERIYHMFPTDEHNYHKDDERLQKFYEKQTDLTFNNNVSIHTICPRSLGRSAQKHFTDYKWKSEGTVFVTPPCHDNWLMYGKLNRLQTKEVIRLFNYIKFLMHNK